MGDLSDERLKACILYGNPSERDMAAEIVSSRRRLLQLESDLAASKLEAEGWAASSAAKGSALAQAERDLAASKAREARLREVLEWILGRSEYGLKHDESVRDIHWSLSAVSDRARSALTTPPEADE